MNSRIGIIVVLLVASLPISSSVAGERVYNVDFGGGNLKIDGTITYDDDIANDLTGITASNLIFRDSTGSPRPAATPLSSPPVDGGDLFLLSFKVLGDNLYVVDHGPGDDGEEGQWVWSEGSFTGPNGLQRLFISSSVTVFGIPEDGQISLETRKQNSPAWTGSAGDGFSIVDGVGNAFLFGTATAVPEPSHYAVILALSVCIGLVSLRKHVRKKLAKHTT